MKIITICLLYITLRVASQPNENKITALPLLNFNITAYSGYVEVNTGRYLHYWFIESQSNPKTDPVVLWLNGGPGCSSLDGLFYENGPIHFASNTSELALIQNPYAWTRIANVIYLESPVGVGFSYSLDSNYTSDDNSTAEDNYLFLLKWMSIYPQFSQNQFWITGESYAGIYIPTLALNILEGNQWGNYIPLKGIMVGNGVANSPSVNGLNAYIEFLYGHGFISKSLFKKIHAVCDPNPTSPSCSSAKGVAYQSINGVNYYDIYADCIHQRPVFARKELESFKMTFSSEDDECDSASSAEQYLNLPAVKQALHVSSAIDWKICSESVEKNYIQSGVSMIPIYKELLNNKILVLIYSGDTDFAVPYTESAIWTSDMGFSEPMSDWRQWFFEDNNGSQLAGFVTEYHEGLTFATVKGAGHMVPQFKPQQAFAMFERFLNGRPL